MVIGRTAGSVWSSDDAPRRSTWRFASCGINCSIGSSSWKRPSSNRRSAAQDVISFVFEKTRNMWSTRKGIWASLSAHPMHYTSTNSLPTSTAEENPERRFPSTYRCMAECTGRKSYPVVVTFMSSMINFVLAPGHSAHSQKGMSAQNEMSAWATSDVPFVSFRTHLE